MVPSFLWMGAKILFKMESSQIIAHLPYQRPFLFVDEIKSIDEDRVVGAYTYREEEFFYSGHFPDRPITPGVILIETMAQIGLVCLGIYLKRADLEKPLQFAFATSEVSFLKAVLPGEKVMVYSEKEYFRLRKLKCKVRMENEEGKVVAKGTLSGMILK